MRRRPMLLLGISVVLILLIVYCSPLPLKFTSRDLRLAMENYAVPEHAVLCGILKSKSGEGDSPVLTLKEVTLEGREGALSIGNVRVLPGDPSVMEKVSIGWVLRAEGDLGVIDGPANPGEFDRAVYYRVQGISFQMRGAAIGVLKESTDPLMDTLYRWRTRVKMKIRELFPSDVSGRDPHVGHLWAASLPHRDGDLPSSADYRPAAHPLRRDRVGAHGRLHALRRVPDLRGARPDHVSRHDGSEARRKDL